MHSGEAVAEPGGIAQVAQVAARLAQAAPPGRLCISQEAAAQVRTLFDVEPLTPLDVTGRQQPVHTGLLRRSDWQALPGPDGAGREAPAALVGRQSELADLQAAFLRLRQVPEASAVTLLGEPGMGKSRLLHEFDRWSRAQPVAFHVLRARATAEAQGQPFGVLGSLLRSFCKLDAGSDAQAARDQFEAVVAPWFVSSDGADLAQGHAHVLGHLIGIDFADSRHVSGLAGNARQLHQLAFNAAVQWLRRLSAEGAAPVLVQLEDLHWADSESLDFLDHLLTLNSDTALLIVSTARPALADLRPAWALSADVHRGVDLGPLSPAASRQLAAERLNQLGEVPPALLDRVAGAAQGNPFCIEERVGLLIDQGVIQARVGGWTVDLAKLRKARLPDSLSGVLSARLKLLPPAERRSLQQASVIGPVFLQDALLALGAGAVRAIGGLVRREMALVQGWPAAAAAAGAAGSPASVQFGFKHQLLQQLSYDTRRALHGKLARWLAALTGPQAGELLTVTAHHFEQAGDEEQAAEQHTRAAEQARSRFAQDAVLRHVDRGLSLLDGLPDNAPRRDLRWRLLWARVAMSEHGGQRAQQAADIETLAVMAEEKDDDRYRAKVLAGRCVLCDRTADYAGMKAACTQGMACGVRLGDDRIRLDAMRELGMSLVYLSDWDAALRLTRQCLEQAQALGLLPLQMDCLNTLGIASMALRQPLEALHAFERSLALARQLGNRSREGIALSNAAIQWLEVGDLVQSRRCVEEALRLARALGHRTLECAALCGLAELECAQGNGQQALALSQATQRLAKTQGTLRWELLGLHHQGNAELLLNRPGAAAQTFETQRAKELHDNRAPGADAEAGLARAAFAAGDMALALRHVERVIELDATTRAVRDASFPRRVEFICYRVLSNANDARAGAWLQRAHAEMRAVAATITDESLREGFLNNLAEHRAILAAWALHEQELAAGPGTFIR